MRKLRFIILSVLLFATVSIICLSTSYANDVYLNINDCGTVLDVFPGSGETFFILSDYQSNYKITYVDGNGNANSNILDLNSVETTYAYRNGIFYFISNECKAEDNSLFYYVEIKKYDAVSNSFTTSIINNVQPRYDATFAYNGNNWYLLNSVSVELFSNSYKKTDEIELNSYGKNLFLAGDGSTVFCTADNKVLSINESNVTAFSINTNKLYTYDDCFSDDNSVIYDAYNGRIVFDDFSPSCGTAKIGEWFVGNKDGKLTAISGSNSCDIGTASNSSFICGSGSVCGCFTPNGNSLSVQIISLDEIEEKSKLAELSTDSESGNLAASSYEIDDVNKIITGIAPNTTSAQFRKSCGLNNPVIFDKNGSKKTSGQVGTGMTVTSSDGSSYTLIIFGDVTGEGNINSRDLDLIEKQVLTGTGLEDKYLLAADIIHDEKIDLKDASALYQNTKNRYEIVQNITQ